MIDKTPNSLISSDEYIQLVKKRSRLIWPLLIITIAAYMSFIMTIAFSPDSLGKPIGDESVISVGIVIGFALIVFNFLITLFYVRKANHDIEPLIAKVQKFSGEK